MEKRRPHIGATHKIPRQIDGSFGIELTIPGAPLVNATGLGTERLAGAWIANLEREIAAGALARAKLHLWKKRRLIGGA